ncbi:MAG: AtpZ/AtpI family protein [Candidatus Marinimicrobia bacterium]|nr:AtpZ/AtpI family protein [Candidatus Neomarinimicrobiota bacterium]MCF7829889.1 AtpZ/AtpI family protein [Candidatus Neomarinimicrobiota bacterium]MCF7879148.1 AtpZ/AtpI family protein [Candidatus Neomarinimicrobiota bacterium]
MKNRQPQEHDNQTPLWETYRRMEPYLGLGFTFTVTILAFLFLGRWLDSKWGTSPWLLITGAALGLILGFVHMFSTLNQLNQQNSHNGDSNSD